jgi:hypothetical protein
MGVTMNNPVEKSENVGELTCSRDAWTGDYSLSLHGAIVELTAENQRLRSTIDDLLNKLECLRCVPELRAFGSA